MTTRRCCEHSKWKHTTEREPRRGERTQAFLSPRAVPDLQWVICGGESGPGHWPMQLSWLEDITDQCKAAGVPLFVKQAAASRPGQQGEIPDWLWRKKEFPGSLG